MKGLRAASASNSTCEPQTLLHPALFPIYTALRAAAATFARLMLRCGVLARVQASLQASPSLLLSFIYSQDSPCPGRSAPRHPHPVPLQARRSWLVLAFRRLCMEGGGRDCLCEGRQVKHDEGQGSVRGETPTFINHPHVKLTPRTHCARRATVFFCCAGGAWRVGLSKH